MAKPDKAHEWTEEELKELEKRIAAEYKKAAKELREKINDYFEKFKARDEAMKKRLDAEEITEEYYKQWRLAQIGRGERFEALRDRVAERMTKANEVAAAYINDATPGLYSLNRNYAAYTIEQQVGADVGFDLWDEQTVKRLIKEQPDLMPYYPPKKAVERKIDLAWGKRQITAQVTSGILQGESIKQLADRLETNIPKMERDSAIRAARTAVTGAQNAGRMDSYDAAGKMGIKLKKEWLATLDGRTRHSHATLDGKRVENGKKFSNGCMFPGDPNGPSEEVYNCRCTMIAAVEGVDTSGAKRRARDPKTGEVKVIEDMTYSQWAGWKEQVQEPQKPPFVPAETIKEAEKFAEKFGVKADYSKYDISVANAVNETMQNVVNEFGEHSLDALQVIGTDTQGKKREGGFDEFSGKLSLNGTKGKDALSKMGDKTRKANQRYERLGMKYFSAEGDLSTIQHEFGHIIHISVGGSETSTAGTQLDRDIIAFMRGKNSDVVKQLSYYATINHNELIAESVAQYLDGNPSEIALGIVELLKKYGLRK